MARISLLGGAGTNFESTEAFTQVKLLLGGAGTELKSLSARIGVKSLLGGGAISKQRTLLAKIGGKSVLGGAGAILKQPKPVSGRCWRDSEAAKPICQDWVKVVH